MLLGVENICVENSEILKVKDLMWTLQNATYI